MTNSIIITTINDETEAITSFKNLDGWNLILVGDKKTPEVYNDSKIEFISANYRKSLMDLCIPLNSYCRKNLGYLRAIENGSDIIYETDDDNIPYDNFPIDIQFLCQDYLKSNNKFENVYGFLSGEKIWNRGFPLEFINQTNKATIEPGKETFNVGVYQTLIDHDPDVDAIYRLTNGKNVNFDVPSPFVISNGSYAPFNSQSTFWRKECFLYMYFPVYVSWRFADILRGYIAQRLMHHDGFHLGFYKSLVYQDRFRNDYMKDFVDEIPMYRNVVKTIEILDSLNFTDSKMTNMSRVYEALAKHGIIDYKELPILDIWFKSYLGCE